MHDEGCATLSGHLLPTEKGFFNCSNFLALMGGVIGEGPEARGWGAGQGAGEVGALLAAAQCEGGPCRYVLMNVGEPLNEVEAEQMMKEADENGDGTLDYEGEQRMGPGTLEA
ncbi:hypothetical protein Celaphus_00011046, partial [Cervus elaphus hippelaphus]